MTDKIKLTDRRVSLSNRYIETLKKKNKRYSVGDSEVIGLRIFVFEGGQKTFYYSYTTKEKEKGLEKLGLFGSVNVKEARNAARKIAKDVMDGRSPIEIRISRSGELTVGELVKTFIDKALKANPILHHNKLRTTIPKSFFILNIVYKFLRVEFFPYL